MIARPHFAESWRSHPAARPFGQRRGFPLHPDDSVVKEQREKKIPSLGRARERAFLNTCKKKSKKYFYFPVFANLGAQEIKRKEIYATGVTSNDDAIFGYQEAWAEYRYKPSIVTGLLNPSVANSLSFWDLANNFGSAPTLSQSFIEQDRTNLARALVTGANGPDFIADFYFDATYVRPMPMYSIPGLIDHH